jgi:hypothetical protein
MRPCNGCHVTFLPSAAHGAFSTTCCDKCAAPQIAFIKKRHEDYMNYMSFKKAKAKKAAEADPLVVAIKALTDAVIAAKFTN